MGRVTFFNMFNALNSPPQEVKGPPKQFVLITYPPENAVLGQDLFALFEVAWTVSKTLAPINLPDKDRDLDAPALVGEGLPEITIHGRTAAAAFIERGLHCFKLHQQAEMPEGLAQYYNRTNPTAFPLDDGYTWLEVGKGQPWAYAGRPCIGPGN